MRLHTPWLLTALTLLAAGCALPIIGGSSSTPPRQVSLWLNGGPPTIVYPPHWRMYHVSTAGGSFTLPMGFLSNRPVQFGAPPGCMEGEPVQRCAPTVPQNLVNPRTGLADCTPHNTVTVCWADVTALKPGQVLAGWSQDFPIAVPPKGLPSPPGKHVTVDGHEARLLIQRHAKTACPGPTEESVIGRVYYNAYPSWTVHHPQYSAWYEMDACIRGPGIVRLQRQVLAMFRSLRGV